MPDVPAVTVSSIYGLSKGQIEAKMTPVTVGTTPVQLCTANPNRIGLLVLNLSANTVWASPLNGVSPTNGLMMIPNGGQLNSQRWEDYDLTGYPLEAVANGAGSIVMVLETISNVPLPY